MPYAGHRKIQKIQHGEKGVRRKQQQTAGLVSALARSTELVKHLEGEKAALEDQIRLLATMGVGGTAGARMRGNSQYSSDHSIFKKEMLIWAYQEVMRLLKEDKTL